jgi:Cellulase (glycosyl hydrolase family 5)
VAWAISAPWLVACTFTKSLDGYASGGSGAAATDAGSGGSGAGGTSAGSAGTGGGVGGVAGQGGTATGGTSSGGVGGSAGTGGAAGGGTGGTSGSGTGGGGGTGGMGGTGGATSVMPAGWLYTKGAKIYVADGNGSGKQWMGRGVNLDDIFFCGYNDSLWLNAPDQALEQVVSGLMSDWKPNFVGVSLTMDSYTTVSWVTNPAQFKTPMTGVIQAVGAYPNVYVMVSVTSDASMIDLDTAEPYPESSGLPSDATDTPDAAKFPTGTDATYVALVDSFAQAKFVMFGVANDPGDDTLSDQTISAAMSHAVGVIRAEEDRLGVPHHLVAVEGNDWSQDISFYAANPLPQDNVVYEAQGLPPTTNAYTYSNIPVIIGGYGSFSDNTALSTFLDDVESKQIPNLAHDFDPYSNCSPDALQITGSPTNLTPSGWGQVVQNYLVSHAQ